MQAGFAEVDITPTKQVNLAGYFNQRPSGEVADPLKAAVAVFETEGKRCGLVVLDLLHATAHIAGLVKAKLAERHGREFADAVAFTAIHTHTGPTVLDSFTGTIDDDYIETLLVPRVVEAFDTAIRNMGPVTMLTGAVEEHGLAFNRRFLMKDGTVATNPPKTSTDVVKTAGPVDHTVRAYLFRGEEHLAGIIVDVCNHTDTIGGNQISADWPGRMAKALGEELGTEAPVLLLNGPAGNINHFDRNILESQTSYAEAQRIGTAYADFVQKALRDASVVTAEPIRFANKTIHLKYRSVPPEEIERARASAEADTTDTGRELTSEDLARGDPLVEALFAKELLKAAELFKTSDGEDMLMPGLRLGDSVFIGLPGEPFVEIGLAIKQASPFAQTTVYAPANGSAGYIPMTKDFGLGGYETRTTTYNRFTADTADRLIEAATELLKELNA